MKYNPRLIYVVLAVAAIAWGTYAAAQEGDAGDTSEVDVQSQPDLSGGEQIAEVDRIQERGTQISRRVQTMLDVARRERDIIRVTCLNDKLTQVNANLRTLEQRSESLSDAGENESQRNHEFTVITVLGQKFNVLEQEANQCLGQDIFETGATLVTTTVDPATPDEDPNDAQASTTVGVPYIPPPASPDI